MVVFSRTDPTFSKRRALSPLALLVLILIFAALACDLSDLTGGSKPNAIITSPPSGSTFHEGEDIAVQSVSTDAKGVVRVELIVDGQIVRTDASPSPQDQFTLVQTWKATQGAHTIIVKSYNGQNTASDPAAISVSVSPAGGAAPSSATATTAPPAAPTSTTVPGGPSPTTAPVGCTNNSAFIADLTVPDGTVVPIGATVIKTWRLSNNGTCIWGAGYQFVFTGGEAMTPNTVISVPSTAPGATVDLSIPVTAPNIPGSHTGAWRLRSSSAALFGAIVSVKITVPSPVAPTPTVTATPATCSGTPVIASFTATATTITSGSSTTLQWGAVTNADSVEIDQGIGGVATPGSTSVSPTANTTYTLTAHCGSNIVTRQVTITVTSTHAVYSTGNATVHGTFHFDLDSGSETTLGSTSDFWWNQVSAVVRNITPQNGAQFAVWGTTAPEYADCAGVSLSAATIDGSNNASNHIPTGTYVCARTNAGRYARFQIVSYGYDLLIAFMTWQ